MIGGRMLAQAETPGGGGLRGGLSAESPYASSEWTEPCGDDDTATPLPPFKERRLSSLSLVEVGSATTVGTDMRPPQSAGLASAHLPATAEAAGVDEAVLADTPCPIPGERTETPYTLASSHAGSSEVGPALFVECARPWEEIGSVQSVQR